MNTETRHTLSRLAFIAVLALSAFASVHALTSTSGEHAHFVQAAMRPMA